MCPPAPSWTLLPPSSPPHPSRLSQSMRLQTACCFSLSLPYEDMVRCTHLQAQGCAHWGTQSPRYLDLGLVVSRTVRWKFLLFKPPRLWWSVAAAWASKAVVLVPFTLLGKFRLSSSGKRGGAYPSCLVSAPGQSGRWSAVWPPWLLFPSGKWLRMVPVGVLLSALSVKGLLMVVSFTSESTAESVQSSHWEDNQQSEWMTRGKEWMNKWVWQPGLEASWEERQMERTASPSPPFTQAVGTTFHEKGSPGTPPLLHVVFPRHPPIGGRGAFLWSSGTVPSGLILFCPSSASLSAWLTPSRGCPDLCFHLSLGLMGRKGLKPASVSQWVCGTEQQHLGHSSNTKEVKYSSPSCRLSHEPHCSVQKNNRQAPGRFNKIQQD